MNNLLKMDTNYEEKRRKKILSNGKNNVQSVYSCGPFTVIPSRALNDKRFMDQPHKLMVLCIICSTANNYTGVCYPSQQYIANRIDRTQPTVSKAITSLIDWGYINRLRKGSPLITKVTRYGKSSIYRVMYDPSMSDKELHSRALNQDEELQSVQRKNTIDLMQKKNNKDTQICTPRISEHAPDEYNTRLSRTRLNNNTISTTKENNKLNEIEMMKEYQKLHYEIYKVRFIPDRRDWQQMIKLITYQDKQTNLLTKVKSILRGKKNASKPPLFPISYINAALEPKGTTPQDIVKDLAKALKPRRRYKFD